MKIQASKPLKPFLQKIREEKTEPVVESYPVDEVNPAGIGARGAVPRVVLCLILRGQLAVGAGEQAPPVKNPGALVAAGEVTGLAAGAASVDCCAGRGEFGAGSGELDSISAAASRRGNTSLHFTSLESPSELV